MARGRVGWGHAVLAGALLLAGCGSTELVQGIDPPSPPPLSAPSAPDAAPVDVPPEQPPLEPDPSPVKPDAGPVQPDAGPVKPDADVWPPAEGWPEQPHAAGSYVGVGPQSLAVADFNGDGSPDLAVALTGRGFNGQYVQSPGAVRVFLNDGHGGFGAPAFSTRVLLPDGLVAGDANGDGRVDLLHFARYGVQPLLNGGDGTFTGKVVTGMAGHSFRPGLGASSAIATGPGSARVEPWVHFVEWQFSDFGGPGEAGLYRLQAGADGTFSAAQILSETEGLVADPSSGASSVAGADFDEDGLLDFAVVGEDGLRLYLRTAPERVRLHTSVSTEAGTVFAHDVDGDGHVDVVLETGSAVRVMRGDGRGGLGAADVVAHAGVTWRARLTDVDGDGRLDLLGLQRSPHAISVLYGQPGGGFAQEARLAVDSEPRDAAAADLDGDGVNELLVAEWSRNLVTIHASPARGHLEAQRPAVACPLAWNEGATCTAALTPLAMLDVGAPGVVEAVFADLDGDGRPDIAAPEADRGMRVLLNEGQGRFRPLLTATGAAVLRISAGDLDGDGRVDLAANFTLLGGETDGWNGPNIGILRNEGGGELRPMEAPVLPPFNPELTRYYRVDAADFNADGRVDLAVMGQGLYVPWVERLTQLADGSFRRDSLQDYCFEPDDQRAGMERPLIADFDRDGRLDYAFTTFGLNLGYTTADGTEREGQGFGVGFSSGRDESRKLSAADLDGDGFLDVLSPLTLSGQVVLFRGDVAGTLQAPARCVLAEQGNHEALDVDGDGTADLVGLENAPFALTVRRGAGRGLFSAARRQVLEARPLRVWAVDLLGLGRPQLAVLQDNGRLAVFDAGCE